jgi:hypothetical protein
VLEDARRQDLAPIERISVRALKLLALSAAVLVAAAPAKRIELPAGTLTAPGGIAVDRHGDLLVSNRATEAGAGEVLEIEQDD